MNVFYWDWEFSLLYALQEIHNPVLDVIMAFVSNLGNAGAFWILLSIIFMMIILLLSLPSVCLRMWTIVSQCLLVDTK